MDIGIDRFHLPDIVKKGETDIIVLQPGSIEITNIEANKAMMDTNKRLEDYKSSS